VAIIPACRAGDPGSIPGQGALIPNSKIAEDVGSKKMENKKMKNRKKKSLLFGSNPLKSLIHLDFVVAAKEN
jgi:hypothetical protein